MLNKKCALPSVAAEDKASRAFFGSNIHRELLNVKGRFWEDLYYNPFLTAGYSGIFPNLPGGSEFKNINPVHLSLNKFENLSIDKIAILFNAPEMGKPATKSYWKNFESIFDWGTTERIGANNLYRETVKWCQGFIIQWGCIQNKVETIRLEFNPNKTSLLPLAIFFSALKSHALKYARVSRLDVAIDYAAYINPAAWWVSNVGKTQDVKYNDIIQTRYFGASTSDVQLRVYNKLEELRQRNRSQGRARDEPDLDNLWRIEAEIKAVKGDTFSLLDVGKIAGFNPFQKMEFIDPVGFNYDNLGMFSLFVAAVISKGPGYALSQLDYKTRKKYLERLQQNIVKPVFHSPADVYQLAFSTVYSRFTEYLHALFQFGQCKGKSIFNEVSL